MGNICLQSSERKKRAKLLKEQLRNEINENQKYLQIVNVKNLNVSPLISYIFDVAVNTGELLLLDDELKKRLLNYYEQVQVFNLWSKQQCDYYFDVNNVDRIPHSQLHEELEKVKLIINETYKEVDFG